jgi:hypothetical protein
VGVLPTVYSSRWQWQRRGEVYLIQVLSDPKYSTKEQLHAGSREAEVRLVFGEPSKSEDTEDPSSNEKGRTLTYDSLGIWFTINLSPRYTYYNAVFLIGVRQPK